MLLLQSPSLSTVFSNARPASRRHPRVWRFRLFSYAMIVRTALHPSNKALLLGACMRAYTRPQAPKWAERPTGRLVVGYCLALTSATLGARGSAFPGRRQRRLILIDRRSGPGVASTTPSRGEKGCRCGRHRILN